jgi:hypothetical protein
MKRRAITITPMLVAATVVSFCPPAFAGPIPPIPISVYPIDGKITPPPPMVKRAKFLCGQFSSLVGNHFTVVNVLNPYSPVGLPGGPPLKMTKEIIVDGQEPPANGIAPKVATPPTGFALPSLAAIAIDCPDISALLQKNFPALPPSQTKDVAGYVVIQVPCVPIGPAPPNGEMYECFDPVIDTAYEHLVTGSFVNKVLFKLSAGVSPTLPGNRPLEVLIPAPAVSAPLDLEAKLRSSLSIPSQIKITVLNVAIASAALGTSLEVVPTSRQFP